MDDDKKQNETLSYKIKVQKWKSYPKRVFYLVHELDDGCLSYLFNLNVIFGTSLVWGVA